MSILRQIRRLGTNRLGVDVTDASLLDRFAVERDEIAFAALVGRHGPMVWGVCRRLLPLAADAEDAFQATFLILVRKAGAVRKPELIGAWLHGVAQRVAMRLRKSTARRQARECVLADPPAAETVPEIDYSDLRLLLDEEVNRLPERFRVAFVLCHLQGFTNDEAARMLGCPTGTVQSRLSRARQQLRMRLLRRGVGLSAAALSTELTQSAPAAPVPAPLAAATVRLGPAFQAGAAGLIPTTTSALAEGVISTMTFSKANVALALLATLGVFGAGSGLFLGRGQARYDNPAPQNKPAETAVAANPPAPAVVTPASGAHRDLELRDLLARQFQYDGLDDPKATLQDALDQMASKYSVVFNVNEATYPELEADQLLKTEVVSKAPLQPMTTSLDVILRKVLARVSGKAESTFVIRKDHIEILSVSALRRELGLPVDAPIPQLVYEHFENVSLNEALSTIADRYGVSIVIDPAAVESFKDRKITVWLRNVPVETAVRAMAMTGDHPVVRLGNLLYVCSDPGQAIELLEAHEASQRPASPAPKNAPPDAPPSGKVPQVDRVRKGNQG